MKQKSFKSEAELCKPVVQWLNDDGWDVYQEVVLWSRRADIVATRGRMLWVIEAKVNLGLMVIDQARRWSPFAHRVTIAVPDSTGSRVDVEGILRLCNVGLWRVSPAWGRNPEHFQPFNRNILPDLRKALREEYRTETSAGTQRVAVTPFRIACRELQRVVAEAGEIRARDAIARIKHHYNTDQSATACLVRWVEEGQLEGVSVAKVGGRLVFRVKNEKMA